MTENLSLRKELLAALGWECYQTPENKAVARCAVYLFLPPNENPRSSLLHTIRRYEMKRVEYQEIPLEEYDGNTPAYESNATLFFELLENVRREHPDWHISAIAYSNWWQFRIEVRGGNYWLETGEHERIEHAGCTALSSALRKKES